MGCYKILLYAGTPSIFNSSFYFLTIKFYLGQSAGNLSIF